MKVYKSTNKNGQTKNKLQWGENVSHSATGDIGQPLCSDGWIHFYTNPLIAVIMNPSHADFSEPRLWEAETSGEELHEALKSGCRTLTTIKEIPLPEVTLVQKIAFAILCTKEVYKNEEWNEWADNWLSGKDETEKSASNADRYAAYSADAAHSAADAAYAASYAVSAYAASYADRYAADAAHSAARSVSQASSKLNQGIDFVELAEKAMTYC